MRGQSGSNQNPRVSGGCDTDEFAGDREIAYFLASAAATAEAETAAVAATTSVAAADSGVSDEVPASTTASPLSPRPTMTLVAIPVHARDPSQRYNPYHLRIVSREMDGGEQWGGAMEGVSGGQEDVCGKWGDALTTGPLLGEASAGYPAQDDGGRREGNAERQRAPGYEVHGDEAEPEGGQGDGRDVERAYINVKGVTYINKYGETSFQPPDEWVQEKERLDAMRQMRFVRRYSSCKHSSILWFPYHPQLRSSVCQPYYQELKSCAQILEMFLHRYCLRWRFM